MSNNPQSLARITAEVEDVRKQLTRNDSNYNWLPLVKELLDWDPRYVAGSLLDLYFALSNFVFHAVDKGEEITTDLQDGMFVLRCMYSAIKEMTETAGDPCSVAIDLHIKEK